MAGLLIMREPVTRGTAIMTPDHRVVVDLREADPTCHLLIMPAAGRRDRDTIPTTGMVAISRDHRHPEDRAAIPLMLVVDTLLMDTAVAVPQAAMMLTGTDTRDTGIPVMGMGRAVAAEGLDGRGTRVTIQVCARDASPERALSFPNVTQSLTSVSVALS